MRRSMIVLGCVGPFLFITSLAPFALAESYARVCATTVDSESNETPLGDSSAPRPGEKLVVYLDASTQCVALILPLAEKTSRLANGWRPQMVELPEWDERKLPAAPAIWNWNKGVDPLELWIVFFKHDAPGLEEIQKLVTAMQNPKVNDQVLVQQTRKLCEKLGSRMSGRVQIIPGTKATAMLVGGMKRRLDFPWRDYAQKVPLNDALEGEMILRHGR